MEFKRHSGEGTDQLIARFRTMRWASLQGQAGINMSWEGYTWILLRFVGARPDQLIQVLQPFNNRFPSTEPEFEQMCMTIRRMAHIIENTPGNLSATIRNSTSAFPTWGGSSSSHGPPQQYYPVQSPDPWTHDDPWRAAASQHHPLLSCCTATC